MTTQHPVEMTEHAARTLAGLPHRGAYHGIGETFGNLNRLLGERGLWPKVRIVLGVYHDDPRRVPEAELSSHAGADLGGEIPDGFEAVEIPAGRYAVMHYAGPYDGLPGAWTEMVGWLSRAEVTSRPAPALEIYLNGPDDVPPEELRTDICMPVE
jgi:AraC family transcriptional regulator